MSLLGVFQSDQDAPPAIWKYDFGEGLNLRSECERGVGVSSKTWTRAQRLQLKSKILEYHRLRPRAEGQVWQKATSSDIRTRAQRLRLKVGDVGMLST